MSNSFKQKIKLLINKNKDNPKRQIENIVIFIVLLIITIMSINYILNGNKNDSKEDSEDKYNNKILALNNNKKEDKNNYKSDDNINQDNLESKLESILYKINGVGNVSVLLTYSQSSEVVAMYNENSKNTTSEETDSEGGKRITESKDISKEVICTGENGKSEPVTQKVIKPKIEGAVIIAKGAYDATVKTNIIQAVEAATGLSTYKIQVFEMKN